MKPMNTLTCLFIAVVPVLVHARADDTDSKLKPLARTPDYCALGDVVGAKVTMSPSAEAVAEATKEGETADRPKGKVDDLLVDCCDGTLSWAIVTFDKTLGFGGKCVAIPFDQLNWNPKDEAFDLYQTVAQLKELPSFDVDAAKGLGFDACCRDLVTLWPSSRVGAHIAAHRTDTKQAEEAAREAEKNALCEPIMIDGKLYPVALPQLHLASEVKGDTLYARGEKFGKVKTAILDRANNSVRYFVVSHGGTLGVGDTELLIPALAVFIHQHDGDAVHNVDRSAKELVASVKYEKPEHGVLDLSAATRADAMFAAEIKRRCDKIRQ